MRNVFLVFILFLASGCMSCKIKKSNYIDLNDKFVANYIKKVTRENDIILSATGGSCSEDIKKIILSFNSVQSFDVDQARDFVLPLVNELLYEMNTNLEIRPYLHTYPVGLESIQFSVSFLTSQGRFVDPPYIAHVLILGDVDYSISESRKKMLDTVFIETYEEALQRCRSNSR